MTTREQLSILNGKTVTWDNIGEFWGEFEFLRNFRKYTIDDMYYALLECVATVASEL